MRSLSYLNGISQTSISVTDNRPAGVKFDRVAPLQPVTQVLNISSTTVSVGPGIEIIEIINGSTANVRYRVEIVPGSGSPLPASSITFASLPTGVTQSIVGNVYTLSGIDSISDWNAIKNFTWNLPANYTNYPQWYLKVSVVYYDGATAADKTKEWLVYDDRFYYVSQMEVSASMSASVLKVKAASASMSSSSSLTTITSRTRRVSASMSSVSSMTATGYVVDAFMNVTSSMTATGSIIASGVSNIASTSTVISNVSYVANPGAGISSTSSLSVIPNELRFRIYHTSGRQNASYAITSYNSPNVTVYWGDGTNTSYTGSAGTYANHTLTHTYTGTGFKEIRVVAKQVVAFNTNGNTVDCPYIYDVYDWGVQRISNSYLNSSLQNQIYLQSVPKVMPSQCVSLNNTFIGCTNFNDTNVTLWNTTTVTQMQYTFSECSSFNRSLDNWEFRYVTNMQGFLRNASIFNQPVYQWDVRAVKNMNSLFEGCTTFNQSITDWTQEDCSMTKMFYKCTSFNQGNMYINLGTTGGDMSYMFFQCTSWSQANFDSTMTRIRNHVELGNLGYPIGITFGYPRQVQFIANTVPVLNDRAYLESKSWIFVDESPQIQILDTSASEGSPLDFTLNLYENDVGRTHTVNLRFNNLTGTAILNEDYSNILYADLALTQPLDLTPLPEPQYYKIDFEPGEFTKHVYIKTFNTANPHPCTVILETVILDSNDAIALDLSAVGTINGV